MYKPCILIVSSALSITPLEKNQPINLKGDYSLEAKIYLEKNQENKTKNINDILYEIIAKEIEEGMHEESIGEDLEVKNKNEK